MSVAGWDGGDRLTICWWVELCHGVFGGVAAFVGVPIVLHVGEDVAGEADHCGFVWDDPTTRGTHL
jgi:hypothetical protein